MRREDEEIEVHVIGCDTLASGVDADWLDLAWGEGSDGGAARLAIILRDIPGALGTMSGILGAKHANIINLQLAHRDGSFQTFHLDIEVHDLAHLHAIVAALRDAEPVSSVEQDLIKDVTMPNTRTETDSFGPIEVPADAYWGAQTERSIENFPFGPREQLPLEIVHALGFIKQAAARVNARLAGLDPKIAEVIQQAAGEVARGDLDSQFPLVIWQTGSGTQSNMNANEVIAGRANEILTGKRGGKEPVHPNDQVNKSQSSNDSFPTAMHIAAGRAVHMKLLPALRTMHARLADQAEKWDSIVKIGRTHLQDATPLTLGPGIFRLCGADRRLHRARRKRAAAGHAPGAGRHCGRHRPQRAKGLRGGIRQGGLQPHPAAVHVGAEQVRGARGSRHDGGAVGRA